jgi:hypothetical protein
MPGTGDPAIPGVDVALAVALGDWVGAGVATVEVQAEVVRVTNATAMMSRAGSDELTRYQRPSAI